MEQLKREQDRSERLLLNILPRPIASRLKAGENIIADHYENVSVLFADLVDFTQFSIRVKARDLVADLNKIFSAFDDLCDGHRVEKIKTIGDAYMVVSGLPINGPTMLKPSPGWPWTCKWPWPSFGRSNNPSSP